MLCTCHVFPVGSAAWQYMGSIFLLLTVDHAVLCFVCAAFSLSCALQLGLPVHVAAIEEVSEYASKVRGLDKLFHIPSWFFALTCL